MNVMAKVTIAGAAAFLLMQFIPYGKGHKNPPVSSEPAWSSPETRGLAEKACFNCHSNETVWPSYAAIAPVSWLVYYDVVEARKELNFSEWQGGKKEGEDAAAIVGQIDKGEMPPFMYLIAHPEAKLSAAEKRRLIEGIHATIRLSAK